MTMNSEAVVAVLMDKHSKFTLDMQKQHAEEMRLQQKQHAEEMRLQVQDFFHNGHGIKSEPSDQTKSGAGGKKRKHTGAASSTTAEEPSVTPTSYTPVPLSERSAEIVQEMTECFWENKSGKPPKYVQETSICAYLPINDEETKFALFQRKDTKKDFGPDNCKPALPGYVSRCWAANSVGMCHTCAGALAKLAVEPKYRSRPWARSKKENNGCKIPDDGVIIKSENGTKPPPLIVKTEKPDLEEPAPPKKSKSKKSSSTTTAWKDGFSTAAKTQTQRKWKDWGKIQEWNPDKTTLRPREFHALYDITEDGHIYLAIATNAAGGLSETWCAKEDRLAANRIAHVYAADGTEVKASYLVHVFRASKIQEIFQSFKAISGDLLYKDVLTKDMHRALAQ